MAGSDLVLHPRVPAWKKLGLKLKYVKDEETIDANVQTAAPEEAITSSTRKSRKRERDKSSQETFNAASVEPLPSGKKRRLDGGIGNGLRAGPGDGGEILKPMEKSVRFALDKKSRDQSTTGATDGILETTVKAETEGGQKERQKLPKEGHKKAKQCTTPTTDASHNHETPILSYLTRYYEDRSAWKFRKNRETLLFKHMFSLERVPSRYNTALLAYLKGLKGEAARQRIRQAAEQAIRADNKAADDAVLMTSEQRTKYGSAIKDFRSRLSQRKTELEGLDVTVGIPKDDDMDAETQKRLERRRRAELVLWTMSKRSSSTIPLPRGLRLGGGGGEEEPTTMHIETIVNMTVSAKKKRKNRTAFVEISSSSSSGSSDDSDDDDDMNRYRLRLRTMMRIVTIPYYPHPRPHPC